MSWLELSPIVVLPIESHGNYALHTGGRDSVVARRNSSVRR
jgi:hypothetical protein